MGGHLHVGGHVRGLHPADHRQPGGDKGDWIQPLVASINCTLWVIYGMLYSPRDWPLAVANMPGIVFGLLAFSTALF
ncbi:Uncharacterised protein [Rothia kristinae]|nr:Uncharacterised protein [Rothia kristinae]